MSKGLATKAFVTGAGMGNWSSGGGWAFNPDHYAAYRPNPLDPPGGTLPDTASITDPLLRANPFFKPFTKLKIEGGGAVPDAGSGTDLSGADGAAHAANYSIRAWLLSHDVPALTNPTGTNAVFSSDSSKDTNMDLLKVEWGAWKHSDLKNAPMDAVGKLFDKIITRGCLK